MEAAAIIGRFECLYEWGLQLDRDENEQLRALNALRNAFTGGEATHPQIDTTLTEYVDGSLPPDRFNEVAAHLETCTQCRADVDDLIRVRESIVSSRPRFAIAAAVAAIIALTVAFALIVERRQQPQSHPIKPIAHIQHPTGLGRAEWDAAVRVAHLPVPPIINELRARGEPLRGINNPTHVTMEPSGIVVESAQPPLQWTAIKDARYAVSIFRGTQVVIESAEITSNSWTPPKPLARGVTYEWQVEAKHGDTVTILPTPPAPPAMFHVLDEAAWREIEEAKRLLPNNHLLAGVLYARAGVRDRAVEELRASSDPAAASLLREIQRW